MFATLAPCLIAWSTVSGGGAQASTDALDGGLSRCIGSDGVAIFTDQRCDDLQAAEREVSAAAPRSGAQVALARSCARNQDDLLFGVRAALESSDVNRLAAYYHWAGMGNKEGYRLMDRLDAFSARPLLDVQLLSSVQRREAELGYYRDQSTGYQAEDTPDGGFEEFQLEDLDGDGFADPYLARRPPPAPLPDLLRVDQMQGESDISARVTYFRLRSNAGCWWLQF